MQDVMTKTKLDNRVMAKVWQLSNPNLEANFSKKMFAIAMHMMFRKRQDQNVQIPEQLPIELSLSAAELDDSQQAMQQQ